MSDLAIVLVLLVAAIVMFAINKPRLDAVALIMLVALPFTGVLRSLALAIQTSSSSLLFVIGDGVLRTASHTAWSPGPGLPSLVQTKALEPPRKIQRPTRAQ